MGRDSRILTAPVEPSFDVPSFDVPSVEPPFVPAFEASFCGPVVDDAFWVCCVEVGCPEPFDAGRCRAPCSH